MVQYGQRYFLSLQSFAIKVCAANFLKLHWSMTIVRFLHISRTFPVLFLLGWWGPCMHCIVLTVMLVTVVVWATAVRTLAMVAHHCGPNPCYSGLVRWGMNLIPAAGFIDSFRVLGSKRQSTCWLLVVGDFKKVSIYITKSFWKQSCLNHYNINFAMSTIQQSSVNVLNPTIVFRMISMLKYVIDQLECCIFVQIYLLSLYVLSCFCFFVNTTLIANLFSFNSSGNNNHNLINQSWSGRHKFPMVKFNLKFKPFKTDISKSFSRESNF